MAISKGDVLQRLTATGLIVGGLLTLVANAVFPRADDPSSVASWVAKAAENEVLTQLAALGVAVGVWAIVAGVAGIYRSIVAGAAAAWARIGFYGVVIGGAMFGVSSALVFGAAQAAASWSGQPADPTFSISGALVLGSLRLFDLSLIGMWMGLTVLAIGMIQTTDYPKWASWSLLILGAATIAGGLVHLFADTTTNLEIAIGIPPGLTSVWAIVVGLWVARKTM